MITIQNIKDWSKPHPLRSGFSTRLYNQKYELSIVGGHTGLYGDFDKTFELALIDSESGDFITKIYYPEFNDDVMGYVEAEKMEKIVNELFQKSFQVR